MVERDGFENHYGRKVIVSSNLTPSAEPMAIFKKQEKPEEITPKNLKKKVQDLQVQLEQTLAELEELKEKSRRTITKIGITRFNPFQEIGGNQSFAIALLNERKDGVIITSYYGRDLNRVYAKRVETGASKYPLTDEEKEALHSAQ